MWSFSDECIRKNINYSNISIQLSKALVRKIIKLLIASTRVTVCTDGKSLYGLFAWAESLMLSWHVISSPSSFILTVQTGQVSFTKGIRSWPSLVVQTYSFHPVKSNDSCWISSQRWRLEEGNGCLFSNSTILNHFNKFVHSKWQ